MRRIISLILSVLMLFSLCALCLGEETDEPNDKEEPVVHHFVKWSYRGDGTHISQCDYDGCGVWRITPCSPITVEHDGRTVSFCPVCGHYENGCPAVVWNRVWQTWNYSSSPQGDFSTILYTRPFGEDSSVLFCASFIYRYDGAPTYFDGYTTFMFGLTTPARDIFTTGGEVTAYLTNGSEKLETEVEYLPSLRALQLTIPEGSWMLVVEEK